jgi:hypothetical protein
MSGGSLGALADDLDHLVANGLQVDTHSLEGPGGDAFAFVQQAEEDVLGADVAVVEEPRFLLGQHHDPAGSIREALKQLRLS